MTSAVLVIVLLTGSWVLFAAQGVVFAIGAFAGLRYSPYGVVYRSLVAPRLRPPELLEDAAPVRFAQGVGLAFAVVGAIGYAAGAPAVGIVAAAMALGAAFANAAFGFCLGCQVYLLLPAALRGGVSRKTLTTVNTQRGAAA